jgi:hypothetical protein
MNEVGGLFDSLFGKIGNIQIITPKKQYGLYRKDGSLQIVYQKQQQKNPIIVPYYPQQYQNSQLPQRSSFNTGINPLILLGGGLLIISLLLRGK